MFPRIAWLDVTDIHEYIQHQSSVTGIQRVVTAVLPEMSLFDGSDERLRAAAQPGQFALCRYDFKHHLFTPVDHGEFLARLAAFQVKRPKGMASRFVAMVSRRADKKRSEASRPLEACAFAEGDVIVCLGAFWFKPFYAHAILSAARAWKLKAVFCVYDLIPIRFQEWGKKDAWRIWERWLQLVLRGSNSLVFCSRHARDDVVAYCGVHNIAMPHSRVFRLGDRFAPPSPVGGALKQPLIKALRSEGYVLVVSSIDIRKNPDLLLRVWERIYRTRGPGTPHLVFIGKSGDQGDKIIKRIKLAGRSSGRVRALLDVNDGELAEWYRGALFTMMPSRMEGWGLPVAESLSLGKMCLSSNAGSLPEVGGDLVEYFDPDDIDRCAALVEKYAFDPDALAKAEARIAAEYRTSLWSETAAQLAAAVGDLLTPGGD